MTDETNSVNLIKTYHIIMPKVNRSVTIDEQLLEVVNELIPNRSIHAQQGLLDAVNHKLDEMKDEVAEPYRARIAHLKDEE